MPTQPTTARSDLYAEAIASLTSRISELEDTITALERQACVDATVAVHSLVIDRRTHGMTSRNGPDGTAYFAEPDRRWLLPAHALEALAGHPLEHGQHLTVILLEHPGTSAPPLGPNLRPVPWKAPE